MSPRPHSAPQSSPVSIEPEEGWHCCHFYYRFDQQQLAALPGSERRAGIEEWNAILDPDGPEAPARLQVSVVSGHRADIGLMLLDACPLRIDAVHQRLLNSPLGPALVPVYSFVSMTEVSEYVPTVEQYAQRLLEEGERRDSSGFQAKLKAYSNREPMMRKQRLTPDIPAWPACCFYPMNKKRKVGENWFLLPFSQRSAMMAEHARSGMEFAGKVSQLITVAVGLDDWEWGVTLWARNPQFLKEIVYRMRYDEASARFGEFGPFYVGYIQSAAEALDHCRVG